MPTTLSYARLLPARANVLPHPPSQPCCLRCRDILDERCESGTLFTISEGTWGAFGTPGLRPCARGLVRDTYSQHREGRGQRGRCVYMHVMEEL